MTRPFRKAWNSAELDRLVDLHRLGMSGSAIGKVLDRPKGSISAKLLELGLDTSAWRPSDLRRFEAFVFTEPNSGCWLWDGALNGGGRANFVFDGKCRLASHFALLEYRGVALADGQCALHHCDNPACVNPDHIFVGTQANNVADMVQKDRDVQLRGEAHGRAKLTDESVCYIRKSGLSCAELSKTFGVSPSTIARARKSESWSHV